MIVIAEHPAARPWTDRHLGECAFPVGAVGLDTYSCCKPTGENARGEVAIYCKAHRKVMYQPVKREKKVAVE